MPRSILPSSIAACICLGLTGPLLAADPSVSPTPPVGSDRAAAAKPAEQCLTDLRAFDRKMEKDGHWLGESGMGYGYPMGGYYGPGYPAATFAGGYQNVRPGYEVRTLVASANILARNGQQQACEDVLATTQSIYKQYAADMTSGGVPMADIPAWRRQEISTAKPVTEVTTAFRSDELLGTAVHNSQNEGLGSVEDLVMSPKTGKIAYLVIGRGGVFGIDEKYVPVPWAAFKTATNTSLLVLETTKADMDAAPQSKEDQFAVGGHFEQQSEKVDAYWKAHLSSKGSN